jgi:hypothetical protein
MATVIWTAALILVSACPKEGPPHMKKADNLGEIGQELGLTIPPSARLLYSHRESGMDDRVTLKVEMKAADWPAFLAGTPVRADGFRPGTRGFLGQDDGAWNPHKASQLRTAQAVLPGQRMLNIGVDDSQPEVVIVYIVNHGT